MELKENPIYSKIAQYEQFYKYLKLLFEDLESLKYQVKELQKDLQVKCMRIRALEKNENK